MLILVFYWRPVFSWSLFYLIVGGMMNKVFLSKLKESLFSVLPIVIMVFVLGLTPVASFTTEEMVIFAASAFFLIVGIGLFNLGADTAMTPMGEYMGIGITKTRNLKFLLSVSFLMGLLITVAEPDLSVLASQVSNVMNGTVLIVTVGAGVGLFLLFAVLKTVFRVNLSTLLMLSYMLLFALCALLFELDKADLVPLSFDSGGVTTGPITVPFIMALGIGIASTIGGHDSEENSFGLIALCSVGPMLAVMLLSLNADGTMAYSLADYSIESILDAGLFSIITAKMLEVGKALGLVVLFFFLIQIFILKLPKERLTHIIVGIIYTFLGLVIFLTSVETGFMPIGFKLGCELAGNGNFIIILIAFILGFIVVLAEPAVHVLNRQVEEVTGGTITKRAMLIALSAGVGISIGLSVIRIIFGFSILYYLIPGYFISLLLSIFVPHIYTAIAFDSGGVASGPLTSGFILPLVIGICSVLQGEQQILSCAFGVVAMVAMTPLITIQVLGFRAIAMRVMRERIVMKRITNADDEQIIYFDYRS